MVSGFFTSPLDQERIASGEATAMATYSTWLTLSRPSNSRVDSLVIIICSFNGGTARLNISLCEGGQGRGLGRLIERGGGTHLHVHSQGLHFLDQQLEGPRNACFQAVVTLVHLLLNPNPSLHVLPFDGEQSHQ